jgi:hypothetical protein
MKTLAPIIALALLTACDKGTTEHNITSVAPQTTQRTPSTPSDQANPHDLQALAAALGENDDSTPEPIIQPIITADGKTQINWSLVDGKQPKVDPTTYTYPLAIDSSAVQNYATSYNITPKQAQHSVVVGMAAPEALGKVLDQLTGKYLGHEYTDGADMTLVIHTTSDVVGERHEYVLMDNFAKGLVLPIVIKPKAEKDKEN